MPQISLVSDFLPLYGLLHYNECNNALKRLICSRSDIKSGEALHPASPVQSLPKAVANMPDAEPMYVSLIK